VHTISLNLYKMPSVTNALKGVVVAAALLTVSACAETEFLIHSAKRIQQPESGTTGADGYYKVGNPYQINGIWYYPEEDYEYDETGIASWYGPNFHGKPTANGDRFDMNELTAAHRTLPMPSIVEVTNLENGRTLRLTVNDRGPYAKSRIIDISRRGAQLLGFESNGVAKVRVRILANESRQIAERIKNGSLLADEGTPITVDKVPVTNVSQEVLAPPAGATSAEAPVESTVPTPSASPTASSDAVQTVSLEQPEVVTIEPVGQSTIFIQAGAFSQYTNANRASAILSQVGEVNISPVLVNGQDLFRVRLGPVKSVEEADALLERVVSSGYVDARIIVD